MEPRRGLSLAILTALAGGTLLMGRPAIAQAATPVTWYVNKATGNDVKTCRAPAAACRTIPGAMAKAATGDTIVISANTYPGGIAISKGLTLQGAGAGQTVIRGGSPVVTVNGGIRAAIRGITVSGGTGPNGHGISNYGTLAVTKSAIRSNTGSSDGGGILNHGGTLSLANSTVGDNAVSGSGAAGTGTGGGISNHGTLTLIGSTITDNTAWYGGGISNYGRLTLDDSTIGSNKAGSESGGGIFNSYGTLRLVNSTISGNAAAQQGGGIHNTGTLAATNSTISKNTASGGTGGISNFNIGASVKLSNTLVAGNIGSSGSDCFGAFTDGTGGHNLIGIGDGCGLSNGQNGDQVGSSASPINPLLGPLQSNGGPTSTMALQLGSPAIGTADPATCLAIGNLDQRGNPRHADARYACDIGAVDTGGHTWRVDLSAAKPSTTCAANSGSAPFETIQEALGCAAPGDSVSIAGSPTSVYTGPLTVDRTLTLLGTGSSLPVISAPPGTPVLTIPKGSTVTLSHLIIHGGSNPSGNGGGIANSGTVTLIDTTINDNTASYGGGVYNSCGTVTLVQSTIRDNTASGNGGGLNNGSVLNAGGYEILTNCGTTIVTNSAIRGNSAGSGGGGIFNGSTLNVTSSTISENSASQGGGIYTSGALTVTNSTLSGNIARSYDGGAILDFQGTLTVTNSTISHNTARWAGGISNSRFGRAAWLSNTLLAGNDDHSGPDDCSGGGLYSGLGGHNLIGVGDGCGLVNGKNGDQVGSGAHPLNPLLGPLQNNGGPTQTMALLKGSPAIDRGDDPTCMTSGATGVNNQDQRGDKRITSTDKTCDIGAYEYGVH